MTYRQLVRERALDRHGFITTRDAADLQVPVVELRKLALRGALQSVGYGVYRLSDAPSGDFDEYAEAVLRVGDDAYLTHDAVLALHGLALVNPRKIRVGTPHRVRSRLPESIEVIQRTVPEEDLTFFEGIRSTTVARAILDSRGLVMDERLRDAIGQADRAGLLTRKETSRLRGVFRRPAGAR